MTSCVGFIPPTMKVTGPLTHHAVSPGPFPVLLVSSDRAWVTKVQDPFQVAPPPAGASYLVPPERKRAIEQYIVDHDTAHRDSSWVLNVEELGGGRQEIELLMLGDGYWGGAYKATSTTITPLYRKSAGPGFALILAPVALLMNSAAWAIGFAGIRWIRSLREFPPP